MSYRDDIGCRVIDEGTSLGLLIYRTTLLFRSSDQCLSSILQTQQAPFGTKILLGPLRLHTRCLGTQMALMLVLGKSITFIA